MLKFALRSYLVVVLTLLKSGIVDFWIFDKVEVFLHNYAVRRNFYAKVVEENDFPISIHQSENSIFY